MKAIAKTEKTIGLELIDTPIPQIGEKDILVKIKAASICGSDIPIFDWDDPWIQNTVKPGQIIGHEFCGTIVNRGSNVSNKFDIGTLVTAEGHLYCNQCFHCKTGNAHICPNQKLIGFDSPGAFAEYIAIPESNLIALGEIPLPIAAIQDPLGNAIHAISKTQLTNSTVLITGCGPIGLMTTALAKHAGAHHIIVTDTSDYRLEVAKKIGANTCLNPNKVDVESVVRTIAKITSGVDIWFEMSGNPHALNQGFRSLRPGGEAILLGLPKTSVLFDFANDLIAKGITTRGIIGRELYKTWIHTQRLFENNNSCLVADLTSIITHQLPITDFEKGFELMKKGTCGKVILIIDQEVSPEQYDDTIAS